MSSAAVSPRFYQPHLSRSPHAAQPSPRSSPAPLPRQQQQYSHSPVVKPSPASPGPPPADKLPAVAAPLDLEEAHRRRGQVEQAEGLSALASQHHKSQYNCLKFGEKGAPMYYVPLSIQLPDHVAGLMHKQAQFEASCDERERTRRDRSETEEHEWISFGTRSGGGMEPERALEEEEGLEGLLLEGPAADAAAPSGLVSDQIQEAMDDNIAAPPSASTANTLLSSRQEIKVVFDGDRGRSPQVSTKSTTPAAPLQAHMFSSIESGRVEHQKRQQDQQQQTPPLTGDSTTPVVISQPIKTSNTHPINISIVVPPSYIPALSPLLSTTPPLEMSSPSSAPQSFRLPALIDLHSLSMSAPTVDAALAPLPPNAAYAPNPSPFSTGYVGNFLLSSCPGKKVRLSGPVKGRGAICRDLKVDLERIKGLGVGCIICCLDDEELGFLGAPYEEYEENARLVGLDIIRIPMPEGLTPTSLTTFDAHISRIVSRYTLKGINVLAHCRGGVGRAGLVASSWTIKMGLVDATSPESESSMVDFGQFGQFTEADLEIAEKVIGLVRRRRSVKAIETFEQVKWLVDYIAFLRTEAVVLELDL